MDIASLGYKIDSSQAVDAAKDLTLMTEAAKKADAAEQNLAKGSLRAAAGLKEVAGEAKTAAGALNQVALAGESGGNGGVRGSMARVVTANDNVRKSAKLTSSELLNLGYQFQDLGVQIASGSNPLTAFIQQGSQMSQVFATARQRGIGFTGVLRGMLGAVGSLAGVLLPLAGVVALVGSAFLLANRSMMKGLDQKKLLADLNLTEKQLEKLKKAGVDTTVTLGDSFKGFFMTLGDYAKEGATAMLQALGTTWDEVRKVTGEALDWVTKALGNALSAWWGAQRAFYAAMGVLWKNFPAVIGDAFITAFNAAGKALTEFANKSRDVVNGAIKVLSIAMRVPLPEMPVLEWTGIENQYRGRMASVGKAGAEGFKSGFSEMQGFFKDFGQRWGANTGKAFSQRVLGAVNKGLDEADKAIKAKKLVIESRDRSKDVFSGTDQFGVFTDTRSGDRDIDTKAGTDRAVTLLKPWQNAFDTLRATAKDAVYDMVAYGDTIGSTFENAFRRIAAAWLANNLGAILNKLSGYLNGGGGSSGNAFAVKSQPDDGGFTPSYDGGGYTGNGPRSGGVDGKGGFPAILHPRETIVDHSKGQSASGADVGQAVAMLAALLGEKMETVAVAAGRGAYARTARNMDKGRLNGDRASALVG